MDFLVYIYHMQVRWRLSVERLRDGPTVTDRAMYTFCETVYSILTQFELWLA